MQDWDEFFRELTASEGIQVGRYRAFRISHDTSRFLVGSGDVSASVNRIELRKVQPADGCVVIQYRYHPGWVCDPPASLEPYPVPEHPAGLMLVRDPPANLVLRFDPLRAVRQPWPESQFSLVARPRNDDPSSPK
jgi:hypothetical protein